MDPRQVLASRKRNMFVRAGIPMIVMIVGGSYFLSTFVSTQMELKDKNNKAINERQFDLDEEHSKLLKKLDIDNFTLSRIPRPEDQDKDKKKK